MLVRAFLGYRDRVALFEDRDGGDAGHRTAVTALAVLNDRRLASGSWDATIKLWAKLDLTPS